MVDEDEEYPPACPSCGSRNVSIESNSEYTGGGYADYWEEFTCKDCGHEWRSNARSSWF